MVDNTFLFLLLAVLAILFRRAPLAVMSYGVALLFGYRTGVVEPLGVLGLILVAGGFWIVTVQKTPWRFLPGLVAGVVSLLFSEHRWPGFHNPVIFDHHTFSPDSAPFSMYINFDKVSVGLFIYAFWLRLRPPQLTLARSFILAAKVLTILVALLMPLALAVSYVRLDIKWPSGSLIWCLNNLLFVVFAEECIYRGMILESLRRYRPHSSAVAVFLSSLLFGLAHYRGGPIYIALAAVAGLFYGFTYLRTGRIQCSMAVHFGLNAIHFFVFSYPSLATT